MINFFKKIIIVSSIFNIFILFQVFAYSPYYTHPDLTEEIAKLWNLKNSNKDLKISQNEIEWMREGAIDEDTPARWVNHFYDPINKVGWQGKHFGTLSQAEGLYSGESMAPKKAIASIDWVVNQEYQAAYGRQYGNQTWQKAISSYIDNDKKSAFIALGHILHLIEDASVPDHTRGDTHADIYGDPGSPYEKYSKEYTNLNKLNIAESLKNKTLQSFSTIQSAFEYLANYSNNNFFSEDTINNREFNNPNIKSLQTQREIINDEIKSYLYLNKVYLARKDIDKFNIVYTTNDEVLILPSYFTHLAPQAVSTGAGVLNLFFQEVERYKKNPELLPEIIPDSNEATLSYLKKSPRLMAVNIGDTIDKTSTNSQIFLAKVSDAVVATYNSVAGLINRVMATEVSPNNNSASVLLATTQNPAVVNNQEAFDDIQSLPSTTQNPIIPASTSEQIIKSAPLPTPLGTPTTKPLVVGVPSGVSYGGGGGASPQTQQETQQVTSNEQQTTQTTTSTSTTTVTSTAVIDTIAPIITILGDNPATSTVGTIYVDGGATALDNTDGAREVAATSTVNTLIAGVYAVTYTANDLSGNTATSTRVVNVNAPESTDNFLYSDLNNNSIADSDESEVLVDANRTLPAGAYRFNNLTIASSSTLTLEGDMASADIFKGVKIIANNLTVNAGSSISADAKGYNVGVSGYGAPKENIYYAGASYGGVGYFNMATSTYGSAVAPTDLGSGGGLCCSAWSAGGGAIQISLTGTLTNNGSVSSGGSPSSSGGSIYVKANTLAGGGLFRANGGGSYLGNIQYGPGGGGRIALYFQQSSFLGKAEAKGGCASFAWPSMSCAENGTVGFFDTTNNDFLVNTSFRFQKNDGHFNFNRITVTDGATVSVENGASITANEILVDKGSSLTLLGNSSLTIPVVTLDGGSTLTMSGNETLNIATLAVKGDSNITIAEGHILSLSVANLTIDPGSYISASEKGYGYGAGSGAPSSDWQKTTYYAGASYGGVGVGNTATSTYGSVTEPTDFGSGGNGYNPHGGGAIRIIVTDNFIHNGNIYANGSNTSSGGSIFVTTNRIEGNGSFSANGGTWYYPNNLFRPGGGGRIAIYYQSSAFTGQVAALGGGCSGCSPGMGGEGSVMMEQIGNDTTDLTTGTTTSDTLAPIITSMSFSTSTGYAKIGDIITLTISADDAGYTLGATTINGVAVAGFTDVGSGAYMATYTVVSGDNDRVSGIIPASVILVDSAGNASVPFTTVDTNTLKLDANIPVLLSALVISTTTVDVLFSEDLNGSTITNKDFSITGHTLAVPDDTLAIKDAFEVSAGLVRLTVNVPFATGETPEIFYNTTVSNGVKDLAGNVAVAGSVLASSGVW